MTLSADEAVGPIDYVLLEFPTDRADGSAAEALLDLVQSGTIRVLDLVVLAKDAEGSMVALEAVDPGFTAFLGELSGARSGIMSQEDFDEAAQAMEPDTLAALIVYENTWAAPFIAAARRNGGEVVASGRIPAAEVLQSIEALEHRN